MKAKLITLISVVAMCVSACNGGSETVVIPTQHWKDADVRIETHPSPPIAGMSEIVVIVTGLRGRPVHDLTISLRGGESMPWVQAIQDGQIGVYRRAVEIQASHNQAVLTVRLQQGEEQKELLFPLAISAE